jgi:hypothetical protein
MVMKFYAEKLLAGGWTLVNVEAGGPDTYSLNWQRGNRHLNVMTQEAQSGDDFGSYTMLTWPGK